jgi:hypothetical protein
LISIGAARVDVRSPLIELFKYWYTQRIERALDSCVFSMSTREHFVSWFSAKRCNQIHDLLPESEIERAVAEAQESLKKSNYWFTREEDWDIFFHGTAEEKQKLISVLQRVFLGVSEE